ncbi:hypothetical protein B0H34DRAFT_671720 [Crassisporium funariophilum]|nr:hypothetical protein B0H34DRAFT_671720 [Crassisporium funariophilum]
MNYGRQSDTSTFKGPDSVKSWGSAYPPPAAQSHVSSWGTVHTSTSHGHGSQSSQATWGPPPASSWGSQSTLVSPNPEAWKCLSPVSSPYAPSLSSATVVEVQSHGSCSPQSIGCAGPRNPSLCPALDYCSPHRMYFDLAYPPSITPSSPNYHPSMSDPAVRPSVNFMKIKFHGIPHWSMSVLTPHPLTVYLVMQQVHHYLQGVDSQDIQDSRIKTNQTIQATDRTMKSINHNFTSKRRIDTLGRRRLFSGFVPAAVNGLWTLYLEDLR